MSRTMAFKRWMFARENFERNLYVCELISVCSMIVWVTIYGMLVRLIGVPAFLRGKLIGVLVVLYTGILVTGAMVFVTFLVLSKIYKLKAKQTKMNNAKRLFKNLKNDEEEP